MRRCLAIGCLCLIPTILAAKLTFAVEPAGDPNGENFLPPDAVAVNAPEDRAKSPEAQKKADTNKKADAEKKADTRRESGARQKVGRRQDTAG